jgi:BirA family biotin operon repressor/biotin-[acetyl-CoA-carboxylase] ligase
VVGVGVNCRSHPPIDAAHPAGDLAALGLSITPDALFGRLAVRMDEELQRWDRGRNFEAVRHRWLARSAGVGVAVRVALPGGDMEGAFETVDGSGRMILRQADGSRKAVSSGDASVRLSRGTR